MVESFGEAADRHRKDAKILAKIDRFQNAGHLIGLAAECLAKDILERGGKTIDRSLRVHFPELTERIRLAATGRLARKLQPVLISGFLDGWHVELRYEQDNLSPAARSQWKKWAHDVDGIFSQAGRP